MKIKQIEVTLNSLFRDIDLDTAVNMFLCTSNHSTKWMLYSDYCLDDKDKPNSVMTFALVPFLGEQMYQFLDTTIKAVQPKDIKKTKETNPAFMQFLRQYPMFCFSFILEDRSLLFGDTGADRVVSVVEILNGVKSNYEAWSQADDTEDAVKDYYKSVVKKINAQTLRITQKKDTKLISDIILIALLGGLYTSKILNRLPQLDIVGWFPDRDKSNEGCDNLIVPIYNAIIYNRLPNRTTRWAFTPPDTTMKPFYDNENRIVDYICGTIADYDFAKKQNSKDKFETVRQLLLSSNQNIRTYRIKSTTDPLQVLPVTI